MNSNIEAGASAARPDGSRTTPVARSLPLRVATSVVFVPLLLALAWIGGVAYLAFVLVLLALALREFLLLLESRGLQPHWKTGIAAVLLAPVAAFHRLRTGRWEEWHEGALITVLVVAVLLAVVFMSERLRPIQWVGLALLGAGLLAIALA